MASPEISWTAWNLDRENAEETGEAFDIPRELQEKAIEDSSVPDVLKSFTGK